MDISVPAETLAADGSVVVGDAADASGQSRAFRWSAATGMQNLSTIYAGSSGSYLSNANAISADGAHVVGYRHNQRKGSYGGFETN